MSKDLLRAEPSLEEITKVLWARKKSIALTILLFGVVGLVVAFVIPKSYTAETIVVPSRIFLDRTQSVTKPSIPLLLGLGQSGVSTEVNEFLAVIESFQFVTHFLEKYGYDISFFPDSPEDGEKSDEDRWSEVEEFRELIDHRIDSDTGLISFSIRCRDPEVSAPVLTDLVREINLDRKTSQIVESEKRISALHESLGNIQEEEIRNAILLDLEEESKTLVFAHTTDEFAFKTVVPAVRPFRHSSPRRFFITSFFAFIGLVIAIFYHVFRKF